MPLLVMILWFMMKFVAVGFARLVYYRCSVEICGNTKRATRPALAIRAVAYSVHRWQRVHRYRRLTTSAGSGSLHFGSVAE
jgi:hypothetical protein